MKLKYLVAVAFLAALFGFGFFRVYYGGGNGFKIVPKYSFGYHDTIVNLDDILGQPVSWLQFSTRRLNGN